MAARADAAPDTRSTGPCAGAGGRAAGCQLDNETVILPRVVGQAMRGEVPGPVELTPPGTGTLTTTTPADVDAVAAGAAIDLLREVELVIETLWRHTGSRVAQWRSKKVT